MAKTNIKIKYENILRFKIEIYLLNFDLNYEQFICFKSETKNSATAHNILGIIY